MFTIPHSLELEKYLFKHLAFSLEISSA